MELSDGFESLSLQIYIFLHFECWNYTELYYSIYYRMYDVYNNAFHLGGTLNVIFDRYLVTRRDRSNLFTQSNRFQRSKYACRTKMRDVTLRVGVVVIVLKMFSTKLRNKFFHYLFLSHIIATKLWEISIEWRKNTISFNGKQYCGRYAG